MTYLNAVDGMAQVDGQGVHHTQPTRLPARLIVHAAHPHRRPPQILGIGLNA
jgi:hypothetical protein